MSIIRTENLVKIYRSEDIETLSLDHINISVDPGEFLAIMGPSGCGKTTLLNILGLIDTPSDGKYFFYNNEASRLSETQRSALRKANIGFIFQSFNLIDELTVTENIELPLLYLGIHSSERKKRVETAMEQVGIIHRRYNFPQQLSGGQQQRAAVARAIITNPSLLLADEPTGNLDSKNGNEIMELLTRMNREGTTILMVTHSPEFAGYAQRLIHLFDGRIVSENFKPVKYA